MRRTDDTAACGPPGAADVRGSSPGTGGDGMKMKRFVAPDMRQAMSLVRE